MLNNRPHRVIDNLTGDLDRYRGYALKADYTSWEFMGYQYHGGCYYPEPIWDVLQEKLGHEILPVVSMYRYYTEDMDQPTWIHADTGASEYTAILFLNTEDQCDGGVAFWEKDGSCFHPDGSSEETRKKLRDEGNDETKFSMSGFVSMVPDRCVVYKSRRFHSRYPKMSFGKDLESGRLIQALFFNAA